MQSLRVADFWNFPRGMFRERLTAGDQSHGDGTDKGVLHPHLRDVKQ